MTIYALSSGPGISGIAVIWFVIILFRTLYFGQKCPDNPWGGEPDTLEWKTTSPPPFHTYDTLPRIDTNSKKADH